MTDHALFEQPFASGAHASQPHGEPLHTLSRRGFLCAATLTAVGAMVAGCGGSDAPSGPGGGTTPPPAGTGATFSSNVLSIPLDAYPQLAATNGFQLFSAAISGVTPNVIVLHLPGDVFRAFTSICTHQQCSVGGFDGTRINCPCHGSQFDTAGKNVAGPAPSPLQAYTASYNATSRVVTVTKA